MPHLFLVTAIGILSTTAGSTLTGSPALRRSVVPLTGGILIGVAGFWILPDMAVDYGRLRAFATTLLGFGVLAWTNRHVYPICPACSLTHDHADCGLRLHGFATPLLLAANIHCFLDGWALVVSQGHQLVDLEQGILWGLAIHKVPEGLVMGIMLRTAIKGPLRASGAAVLTQSTMLLGGMAARGLGGHFEASWLVGLLGLTAGSFLFLGFHAMHSDWKERGPGRALLSTLVGAASAAVLEQALHAVLR